LVVPVTAAANCCDLPPGTVTLAGEMETLTGAGVPVMLTLAEADLVASATLFALTMAVPPLGTLVGALYNPVDETVP
jgi:hypothetical protein